jgi:N-carbamoyl-L-amino-acid hydrolase
MPLRHDALVAASKLVLAVNRLAAELEICRVGTVGTLEALPNAVNVVPGQVRLGVEFRDVEVDALSAAEAEFRRTAAEIADAGGVKVSIRPLESTPSVPITRRMQSLVEAAAQACGLPCEHLPSGAGHDAQAIAAIADVGMIFVPSVDGVSHAPEEFTTPEDCANGAQVLLNLLLLADERLQPSREGQGQ